MARIYDELLESIDGITTHPEMSWAKNVYWMYSILVSQERYGMSRDILMTQLMKEGVETRRFFYPLHILPVYRSLRIRDKRFPVSEHLSNVGLNLPSGPKIGDEDVNHVANLIKNYRDHEGDTK